MLDVKYLCWLLWVVEKTLFSFVSFFLFFCQINLLFFSLVVFSWKDRKQHQLITHLRSTESVWMPPMPHEILYLWQSEEIPVRRMVPVHVPVKHCNAALSICWETQPYLPLVAWLCDESKEEQQSQEMNVLPPVKTKALKKKTQNISYHFI